MRKYSDVEIQKAIQLRRQHNYSFVQLQKLTGIPATTIRNWCKNINGNKWKTLLATNQRKRDTLLKSELSALSTFGDLSIDQSKTLAALLYWCEGAKYPNTNKMYFTNSDPSLLKTFITLLRRAFPLDEHKFRVHLQIHDTHNYQDVREYWSKLLAIPSSQFIKPTITKANGRKHRNQYFGTCSLRYLDFKTQLKLIGIYKSFAKKFNSPTS